MTLEEEKMVAGLQENLWASKRRFKEIIEAMSSKHVSDMKIYQRQVEALFQQQARLMRQVEELEALNDRNEGRRLFQLCVKNGAIPGHVYQWLKEKLQ